MTPTNRIFVAILFIGTLLIVSCNDDGASESGEIPACIPGEFARCPCPGSELLSTQQCADDGRSWKQCDCGIPVDASDSDSDSDSDTDTDTDSDSDTDSDTDSDGDVTIDGMVFRCDLPDSNMCQEYYEPIHQSYEAQALEVECDRLGGTSSLSSPCPETDCTSICDTISMMGLRLVQYNGTGVETGCLGTWSVCD